MSAWASSPSILRSQWTWLPEAYGHAVGDHLGYAPERVPVPGGRLDRLDHLGLGFGVEAADRGKVHRLEVPRGLAHARGGSVPPAPGQPGRTGLGGDLRGGPVAVAGQHGEGPGRDPVLGGGIAGLVKAPGRTPQIFENVNNVDNDVNFDAPAGGLGADQVQLVLGPVDQDDPGPQVAGVAGLGLVERGGDHLGGVPADGPGQPLGQGLRPGPERTGAVPAAGRGDHVVRPAFAGSAS